MSRNFQVDLRAIIQLLSNNLYSGPQVFVRELLQNSVDALRARRNAEPDFQGRIELELMRTPEGGRLLVVEDNGIGLTEEEVHQFLATIGSSSKRDAMAGQRSDYIGQFGIGLLSCFIVTDEIVLLTQSAKSGSAPVEWRGKSDGSYALRPLDSKLAVGTKIYLRMAPGKDEYFDFNRLLGHARNYAGLLPIPITLQEGEQKVAINVAAPWRTTFAYEKEKKEAFAAYGSALFETDFFDSIPLQDSKVGFEGVAYVLPYSPSPSGRKVHRLHLKDMLISEEAENFVPEWAFFVKCIVNAQNLTPTASRESVCENEALQNVRESIARQLKNYIQELVKFDPARLQKFLELHALAIKQLSTFDDDFLLLFVEHLPFETNFGPATLAECRKRTDELFHVPNVDEFRQVAEIAAAQGILVINAGYVYEAAILERHAALKPERAIRKLSLQSFAQRLQEISLKERAGFHAFLEKAGLILQRFGSKSAIRHFHPESQAVIFIASRQMFLRRSAEDVQREATPEWGGILENIFSGERDEQPELCFNASNPLVQQLATFAQSRPAKDLKEIVEVLYVQALLFSRRSPRPEELQALNEGVIQLAKSHLTQP